MTAAARKRAHALAALLALAICAPGAWAQGRPTHPIKLVVAFTPDGTLEQLHALIEPESAKWGKLARSRSIKAE